MQPCVCGSFEVRGSFWEQKTLCSHLKVVADVRSPGLCSAFVFCQTPRPSLLLPKPLPLRIKPHRLSGAGEDHTEGPRSSLPAERRDKRHFCFDQRVRSAVYCLVLHLSMILNVSYLLITPERRASAVGSSLQHNVYRVPTYALGCTDIKEPRRENAKTKHTKNNNAL